MRLRAGRRGSTLKEPSIPADDRLHYHHSGPSHAMELFGVLRRVNLALLGRASPSDLKRMGVHVERGEESLEHLRRLIAGPDLLHLRQIARVRAVVT